MKIMALLFVLFTSLNLAAQDRKLNNLAISEDSIFTVSKHQDLIDSLTGVIRLTQTFISENEDHVELMAIVVPSTKPIRLPDRQWPEKVSSSINILRTVTGKLTYYAEYPSSESGDWFIGYRYYLDSSTGYVVAFERLANFFNGSCTSGVIMELSTYYFSSGELIAKSYSLVNNDSQDLSEQLCFFPYDYEYEIAKNVYELLK